jgi:Flp pilus assembly protein TadB
MTGQLIVLLALVFAALFMLALLLVGSMGGGDRGRDVADRIERYGPRHGPAPARGDASGGGGVVGWVTGLLQSTNSEKGLAERLDLAGSERKPAEWVLLGVGGSALLAAALTLATGNLLLGVLGGALIGWLGMHAVLSIRIGRRRAAFSEQLPDVLQLIAGSLQSGFSLPQAVDAVVREGTQPAAEEFSRALAEARIGADLEDALNRVADRMDSTDLRWTVMAIRIQREVGGNLAEVLRTTVGTMRERAFLRRQVKALSSEGRLSAYILVALPVVIGGWFFFSAPSYMRPLYTTLIGLVMLVGTAVLVVVGAFWMRKLIKIEV